MSVAPLVFRTMGTVVSLRTLAPLTTATADAVRTVFQEYEDRFSLWRPDSEGSRVAARRLRIPDASEAFRAVYDEAVDWRSRTGGAFTPHRPDGVVDLSGLVKALAIAGAGEALARRGVRDWCLNAGGDVLTSGARADGSAWVVGVVDPADRSLLLSQFATRADRAAVATSGTTERGEHIWRLGADATFRQVSVCAADIVTADVLATAIAAGGPSMIPIAHDLAPVDVLAAGADGRLWASDAFRTPPPPATRARERRRLPRTVVPPL